MDYLIDLNYVWVKSNDEQIIDHISEAFEDNDRMKALIGKEGNIKKYIRSVISFSYHVVKKNEGIFSSKNESTYLLYYRQNEHYFSFRNLMDYLYLAFFVVGFRRIPSVIKREKQIKKTRQLQIQKSGDNDFLYVWFLAQKKDHNGLMGLVEAKNFILQKGKELNLPIYMETTDERLLKMYQRAGFEFYNSITDDISGMKVWFGRCQ